MRSFIIIQIKKIAVFVYVNNSFIKVEKRLKKYIFFEKLRYFRKLILFYLGTRYPHCLHPGKVPHFSKSDLNLFISLELTI